MEKELEHLVSNLELEKKFKRNINQIKIMVYSKLNEIEDIIDILPLEMSACFILLRTSEQSGHWTSLCRNGQDIYYFDSYGVAPDGELSQIAMNVRYELGETERNLIRLIKTIPSGFSFSYNNKRFQQYSPVVNTCGKWNYVFCKSVFLGMTLEDFQKRMEEIKSSSHESFDNIVCMLWSTM